VVPQRNPGLNLTDQPYRRPGAAALGEIILQSIETIRAPGTKPFGKVLFCMTDLIEEVLAPAVIERALSIFESFRERNHCEIVQARKVLTPHVFALIEAGQTDEMRLVVSALTYLKSLEARTASEKS
jgi:hypothetical protein